MKRSRRCVGRCAGAPTRSWIFRPAATSTRAAKRSSKTAAVPIGTVPIYSMIIGRSLEELDRRAGDPGDPGAPSARKGSTTSRFTRVCFAGPSRASCKSTVDRDREPRAVRCSRSGCSRMKRRTRRTPLFDRDLRCDATVRRELFARGRVAPGRIVGRDRRGTARRARGVGRAHRARVAQGLPSDGGGTGAHPVRSDRVQHEASTTPSATAPRFMCWARS